MAINDWRVWATRPSAANTQWAQLLHAQGFATLELPLMDIKPLTDSASQQAIKDLVLDFDQFDKVIFVSQNAVHHAFEWLHDYWPQLPSGQDFFAVGERTSLALAAQSANLCRVGQGMNTEGLLALPDLQDVWGKKILICRGRGGLPKLGEILHQRGAMVRYLELYERLLPEHAAAQLRQATPSLAAKDLLVAFSGETLHNLVSVLAETGWHGWKNPLLVPGSRVAELAQAMGFEQIIAAPDAGERSMLNSLLNYCKEHRPPNSQETP